MKAAVLHGPRSLRVEGAPAPTPAAGEVLVRVAIAGLCGTDYSIFSGERPVGYPRIMGHEFVGRIEAVGPGVTTPRVGDRVAIEPNYSCGACPLCREGNRNLCLRRTAIGIDVDGCFADLVRVPARCCWPTPAGVSDEDLMITEPLAVVVRAVARGQVRSGEATAVVGAGTLGLLTVQVLRAHGARVLAVSRSQRRLALAQELGAEATHASAEGGSLEDVAREFSHREGLGCVVETAGTAEAAGDALRLVRPGGRVVLTGLPHDATPVRFFSVVRREISIVGSMIYQDEFAEAMQLVAAGKVKTRPLVTHRFALDEIEHAFAVHRDPSSIKVALTP
jgi:2-desacetyl-2-hydroxyethyl bacteriochlorophyllide A dehydrogenase